MQKPEKLPVTFAKNDVEIIARETLYSGFFSMDLYRFRHRLFNGEMSGEIRREIFERGHAAVLLPFDPVRDEVVLVEQIRIAAYDVSESPWLLEMVAGTTIPLSLIALGLSLKTYGVRADVPVALMICVLRLLVHPAIAFVVANYIFALPPAWTGTVVLFAAMPAGINAYLFAERYRQGVADASSAITLSTLLSLFTTAAWLTFLGVG